jgi:N-acylglucosamine 2-epimerase
VTDAFAIMGMTEYARATGNEEAKLIALETYGSVCERLAHPGTYKTAPYPTPPGMKAHRERMQFSLAFYELGKLLGDERIRSHGLSLGMEVLDHFVRRDRQVLLEYLGMDGQPQDTPAGRTMVPGHGIESCYFQILIFNDASMEEQVTRACEPIRWCLEKGWDAEYGGLFLGIDVEGRQPVYWRNAEMKLWWPHAEALAACLLAHEHCREPWCLDWYWKVHEWSFRHFPVPEHGEWTQRLDRRGNKVDTVVALPVKDPFHLPRALIVAIESLRRIERE